MISNAFTCDYIVELNVWAQRKREESKKIEFFLCKRSGGGVLG